MFLKNFNRWRQDTSGVVAMVVVFCIPAFIAAAGVAVDLAQAYNLKTRLSAALDKAALAAGNTSGMTSQEIEDRVDAFIAANYPPAALGESYDVSVLTPPGMVDISARSRVRTVFMNIFGQEYIDVYAETIVKKEVSGLELVMVLDTTGSMLETAGGGVTKIAAAKTAANTLLNILYGSNSNVPKLYVGVVPFSQNVNIGTQYSGFTTADSYDWGSGVTGAGWGGCVEARYSGAEDVTVTLPSSISFPKYYYPCSSSSNPWRFTTASNLMTNGTFGSSTGWTLSGAWGIGDGELYRTATAPDIAVNGDFSSSAGWTLETGWAISGGVLTRTHPNIMTDPGTGTAYGEFGTSTGWTLGSYNITGGQLTKTSTTGTSSVTRNPYYPLVNGYDYSVTFTVVDRVANSVRVDVGGDNGTSRSTPDGATYTETLTAAGNATVGFETTNGWRGIIDNLIVRQLDALAVRAPATPLVSGQQYEVIFTLSGYSSGSVRAYVGGNTGTARSSNGTFTQTITAGSSSANIGFVTDNGFVGTIDSYSIRAVGVNTATAAPSLSGSTFYLVEYTIETFTSGSVQVSIGSDTSCDAGVTWTPDCGLGTIRTAAGTYKEILRSDGTDLIKFTSNEFVGRIDDVKILPACGGSGPYTYYEPLDEGIGPNKACSKPLLEMTGEKADIAAKINELTAQGSTMIHLGMSWAYRMLDETWEGEWTGTMADATSPGPLPLPYNTSGMNKAVILMTDGDNTFTTYSAYGDTSTNVSYSSCSYGTGAADKFDCKTRDVCAAMKAQNILVYTIALGQSLSSTSLDMLEACATSPAYAFTSPTTDSLTATFTTIANQLNSLYIVY